VFNLACTEYQFDWSPIQISHKVICALHHQLLEWCVETSKPRKRWYYKVFSVYFSNMVIKKFLEKIGVHA